ncbi:hypothetical protein PG2006B_1499 [Bifidobacterium animalis subsp. animalis]|nr:hypothetical protein PG2006B_1499 [Bifidobacterium animalis subsp. animalis]
MEQQVPWAKKISIHTSPKGGDNIYYHGEPVVIISIHTSPKGGDNIYYHGEPVVIISIHTSPKGGDGIAAHGSPPHTHFNPHLPEGR